jgi:hypothetical protein
VRKATPESPVPSSSSEQGPETGLLEVMVTGEGFRDATVCHDDEGDAIGEGPRLVEASGIKIDPAEKKCSIGWDYLQGGMVPDLVPKCEECAPKRWRGQGIRYLDDHPVRRDELRAQLGGTPPGDDVGRVIRVQKSEEVERVGETRDHFFGVP